MYQKGALLNNAGIESLHALRKKETLYSNDFKNHKETLILIHKWLRFYNEHHLKKVDSFFTVYSLGFISN